MFLKLFYKSKRENMLKNSFCEGSITLTPKLDNTATLMNTDTNIPKKILANWIQHTKNIVLPD